MATAGFARRYSDALSTRNFRTRLKQARRRLWTRRLATTAAVGLALYLGLWSYDALGESRIRGFAQQQASEPALVRAAWDRYQNWHPSRHLLRPTSSLKYEQEQLETLDRLLREQARDEQLTQLRRRSDDPDADPEAVWTDFLVFREEFPEQTLDSDLARLRQRIKIASDRRRDIRERQERARRERLGLLAVRELETAERSKDLGTLTELAGKLAREHARTTAEAELLRRQVGGRNGISIGTLRQYDP